DVHTVVGKSLVNEVINYTLQIYKHFGFDEKPSGLNFNDTMDKIKRKCIENGIQLVDTPTVHLGTDGSRILYAKLIDDLLGKDVEFLTERDLISFEIAQNKSVTGVKVSHKNKDEIYYSDSIVVGVGRSGSQVFKDICLQQNIKFENGAVDLGVRVEVPDIIMKEINENFYEAKMIYYTKLYRDKMRTFCSNPSGFIAVENHSDNVMLVNGHSYKDIKSTNTNLALLCTKTFTYPFNQPYEYATSIAKMTSMLTGGKILLQSYGDLKVGRRSTDESLARLNIVPSTDDYVAGDISLACPKRILDNIIEFIEAHDRITPGFASNDLLLYFPEIKFRSTRLKIDKNMQTSVKGLYAAGDASGYGSGLNIAAVMGILAVRHILG
ncbi:MAG: NAD(P)/FAD-dependent oxidoreductase, partial [Fusobacteriaceae bacterium]